MQRYDPPIMPGAEFLRPPYCHRCERGDYYVNLFPRPYCPRCRRGDRHFGF